MTLYNKYLAFFSLAIFGCAIALPAQTQPSSSSSAPASPIVTQINSNPATTPTKPAHDIEAATRPMLTGIARVNDETVTAAIRRGVDYLLKVKDNNNWEPKGSVNDTKDVHYGVTCLVLYALLHVGESLDDPRLKPRSEELAPVIKFVLDSKPETIYAASLQANVLALLPKRADVVALMDKRKVQLVQSTRQDFGHSYFLDPNKNLDNTHPRSDSSNTQYAQLGLWAIQDAGNPALQAYWQAAEKYWRTRSLGDGGFPYFSSDGFSTYSMTAAGAASLLITDEFIDRSDKKNPRPEKQLEDALTYLGLNFHPEKFGGYTLYALERVGLMSGRKFLGKTNWFTEGAAQLLDIQKDTGEWRLPEIDPYKNPEVSTAFALLFLARGRNPVVFNKLQYGALAAWNNHPRDAANLMNWMSHQFERQINFQVVSVDSEVDDWLDAPVLLITGAKDPQFDDEQVDKLRQFTRLGGLIFSTADDNSAEFTAAMQRYAEKVAGEKYKWRELPKDHLVYNVYQKMPDNIPPLSGISNGLRELWIHSPKDFGAVWQTHQHPNPAEKSAGRIDKERPWEMAANIFFYANGRGVMRSKLQSTAVAETMQMPIRSMRMGRLQWRGDWNYEPGAFDRLARLAKTRWRTEVDIQPVAFRDLKDCKIVYMDGAGELDLKPDEKNALREFTSAGGILIANSPNSSTDHDRAFQALIADVFSKDKWQVLDESSPVFSANAGLDMVDAREITTRLGTKMQADSQTKPKIFALTDAKTGRIKILYTPYDITLGLLGTTTSTFVGYSPESSEKLMRNMLLYSYSVTEKKDH